MNGGSLSIPELETRMRPGAWSHGGFLGPTESLGAVLAQDRQHLEEAQVTHDQVADALERVLQLALDQREGLRAQEVERRDIDMPDLSRPCPVPLFSPDRLPDPQTGYLVKGVLQVFFTFFRGFQGCPWGCADSTWGYFDFLILNRRSGEYLTGPGLIVHLIRAHRFFEGNESPYRVDPPKAIRVLEMGPDLQEPSTPPAVLLKEQFQASREPSHPPAVSWTVSHWPTRLIGVVCAVVFALLAALGVAADSPCAIVLFLPLTPVSIALALLYGQTTMNQWGITHSAPLGRYALDWDEMDAVVLDSGGNTIVFKGEGKQLVLPLFSFWAGRDKAAMGGLMALELKRRGIEISRGFTAFAVSRGCRALEPLDRGKGSASDRSDVEADGSLETALQPYLNRMIKLIEGGLGESAAGDPKRDLARRWTQTALRQLDRDGKGALLRFLYESGLIGGSGTDRDESIVSLKGADLRGSDLSGAKLRGANLSEACLWAGDMRRADLSEAHLSWAAMAGADLSGAILSRADLTGARLGETNLSDANLSGANLIGADLSAANLRRAKVDDSTQLDGKWRLVWSIVNEGGANCDLSGADLRWANLAGSDLRGANLGQANLAGADLSQADLSVANLNGADLNSADLREADLSRANLNAANLARARLHQTKLDDATGLEARWQLAWSILNEGGKDRELCGADLRDAGLSLASLQGAGLRGADLTTASLEDADLSEADLQGAHLPFARLSRANLHGAGLRDANLHHAFLEGADLSEADLSGAFLGEAYLIRANLSGARLDGANLSKADLQEADLKGAQVEAEQLAQALTLKDAIMPDGAVHE